MADISFTHARDHAVVTFVGELDWEASHKLVNAVETVVDDYFYTEVELLVVSPGGDTRAFAYYLTAFEHWRRQGVRFRTRVISSAASAGAAIRSPIPAQTDHSFRWKPITDSGANRSVIPVGNRSLLGCAPEWCMGSNPRS